LCVVTEEPVAVVGDEAMVNPRGAGAASIPGRLVTAVASLSCPAIASWMQRNDTRSTLVGAIDRKPSGSGGAAPPTLSLAPAGVASIALGHVAGRRPG
jgi:hypothetical protein